MRHKAILATLIVAALTAGPVLADWDIGDDFKMHYPQLPNLVDGLDVLDGPRLDPIMQMPYSKYLADDFLCTQSGPITDIHIWSSYNFDMRLDYPAGTMPMFNLAIYSDIPAADSPTGYSMPGELLWSGYRPADVERVYATNVFEDFYDPNQDMMIGFDHTVYQYNFFLTAADEPFEQVAGTTYWLGVNRSADVNGDGIVDLMDLSILQMEPEWAFGWKTSRDHWNDDAVWTDIDFIEGFGTSGEVAPNGPWNELVHPYTGESLDLAFVITPEPASMVMLGLGGLAVLIRRRRRKLTQ